LRWTASAQLDHVPLIAPLPLSFPPLFSITFFKIRSKFPLALFNRSFKVRFAPNAPGSFFQLSLKSRVPSPNPFLAPFPRLIWFFSFFANIFLRLTVEARSLSPFFRFQNSFCKNYLFLTDFPSKDFNLRGAIFLLLLVPAHI